MVVLGVLSKSKKGLGIAFSPYFLHDFSIEMFLDTLSMHKVSISYLFFTQDIKQNMLLSSYLDN